MKTAVLILDNIRSVENTGSIFRTAECLGVPKIYLIGTTPAPIDRFGRVRTDFSKVALGAENLVEWEYQKEIDGVIEELKEQNFKILALEQDGRSVNLETYKSPKQFALIVGNEVDGVSKNILNECDEILEIKMKGEKESLNVSVATGIALYQLLN
ncbi:MAG: TrmH family RNA methyltransferase [Minisyncoccia bacterium]